MMGSMPFLKQLLKKMSEKEVEMMHLLRVLAQAQKERDREREREREREGERGACVSAMVRPMGTKGQSFERKPRLTSLRNH